MSVFMVLAFPQNVMIVVSYHGCFQVIFLLLGTIVACVDHMCMAKGWRMKTVVNR